jgi:hypothetical protein
VSATPATDVLPPHAAPPAATDWTRWQRVGLRGLLLYWLLYSFPTLPQNVCSTAAGLLDVVPASWREAIGVDLTARPWRWPGKWAAELGDVESWWQAATTWLSEHGLTPYEVIHQPTGSGDTGHDVARLLATFVATFVLTAIWSLLDRSRGYPRLGRWLHALVRFDLAFVMLSYGWAKVLDTQFGELHPMRLLQTIGDTSPMGLVGTLLKANKPYEVFAGLGEVVGALLLLHRRTALLGACITVGVLTNVCALNWLCGVPVKLYAANLLLAALALLLPFRARLWDLFVADRGTSAPVDLRLAHGRWTGRCVAVAGWAWALAAVLLGLRTEIAPDPRLVQAPKSSLYGVWTVDRVLFDGQEQPSTDATRWQLLAIDRGTRAFLRDALGRDLWLEFTWDEARSEARVGLRGAPAGTEPVAWTIEQGTRTVPVDVPLLLRPEDRGRTVDGERRSLVLRGPWLGRQLELHVVERRFRVQAGFRLRQELPEGW